MGAVELMAADRAGVVKFCQDVGIDGLMVIQPALLV